MSAPPPPRLLLVGMMGAGKSTVGRAAARRLGWAFLDTDEMVQAAAGRSVAEIFAAQGEAAFREAEAAALRRALTGSTPVVVAVAGGAVLDGENRRLLGGAGTVVWLRARPETLAARLGGGAGRPLLEASPGGGPPDPKSALVRIEAARRALYEALADAVVDVEGGDPETLAGAVVAVLGAPGSPAEVRSAR